MADIISHGFSLEQSSHFVMLWVLMLWLVNFEVLASPVLDGNSLRVGSRTLPFNSADDLITLNDDASSKDPGCLSESPDALADKTFEKSQVLYRRKSSSCDTNGNQITPQKPSPPSEHRSEMDRTEKQLYDPLYSCPEEEYSYYLSCGGPEIPSYLSSNIFDDFTPQRFLFAVVVNCMRGKILINYQFTNWNSLLSGFYDSIPERSPMKEAKIVNQYCCRGFKDLVS